MGALLEIIDVSKSFPRSAGPPVRAVTNVTLALERGEAVTIIGESGSGKSTLARLALGMIPVDSGRVSFDGQDLAQLPRKQVESLRSRLTVVFQEPLESLNPRMKIGPIVEEPLAIHFPDLRPGERRARAIEALQQVALNEYFSQR